MIFFNLTERNFIENRDRDFGALPNTHTLAEHLADPALPRRYMSRPGVSWFTKAQKADVNAKYGPTNFQGLTPLEGHVVLGQQGIPNQCTCLEVSQPHFVNSVRIGLEIARIACLCMSLQPPGSHFFSGEPWTCVFATSPPPPQRARSRAFSVSLPLLHFDPTSC